MNSINNNSNNKPKNSRAKIDASNRYVEKTYNRHTLRFTKKDDEIVRKYCEENGYSINGFISHVTLLAIQNGFKLPTDNAHE